MIDDRRRAMNGIELAIRRVSDRLKADSGWSDMRFTTALDEIADEIARISSGADIAAPSPQKDARS